MDSAVPTSSELWARLCRQFSWAISGGAFVLGMCGGGCILVSVPAVIVLEESGVVGGDTPFDSAAWKRNRTYSFMVPVRYRMSQDLVAEHALVGKSTAEIVEVLGPPDWHGLSPQVEFGYSLRRQLSHEVVLWFGVQNGIVSEVREVHDSSD